MMTMYHQTRRICVGWACVAFGLAGVALAQPQTSEPQPPAEASASAGSSALPGDDEAAIAQLQAEIDAMLRPGGLVAPPRADQAEAEQAGADAAPQARLEKIASKSNAIARESKDQPDVQYRAQQVELRAYHALAQDAVLYDRAAEASYRLTQLRNAATQARRSDNRLAAATGDFWLLLADLIDINRNVTELAQRQARAVAKLDAYLAAYDAQSAPEPIITQVKTARVRLGTQSGDHARSCELLEELRRDLAADDPRLLALADAAAVCDLIGKPVAVRVRTLGGQDWSSASSDGPMLLHFYADWSPPSVAVFESLAARAPALEAAGVRVLSISIGSTAREAADQPWPVAVSSLAAEDVAARLRVQGLPWLMWLDETGRVRSAGQTQAVVDRLLALLEAESAEAGKPTREDAESP